MDYWFRIDVQCRNDSFSASALGEQGEWSRGLNIALENLLNKLLQKGIRSTIQPLKSYEPDKEIPSVATGSDTPGSAAVGENAPPPSPKARKKKLSP